MKGRHIHKFFHWIIMTLLLTFPILMVGISTFGKESQTIDVTETYEYETNEVNSINDLVVGNIYKITFDNSMNNQAGYVYKTNFTRLYFGNELNYQVNNSDGYIIFSIGETNLNIQIFDTNDNRYLAESVYPKSRLTNGMYAYFVYDTLYNSSLITNISASDYLGEKNVDYVIHNEDYKQDVNNWINGFLNLPINAWYQSLMNVIGVGFTNSTVMNVIYVMPLYIIWVFIFDLVVDCFLVLIRLPHKLLNRLSGGENE